MTLKARPATRDDVVWLAGNLRKADLNEIKAAGHNDPEAVLVRSLEASQWCDVMIDQHDQIIGIFGVATLPTIPDIGVPWMMSTDRLVDVQIPFLRQSRKQLERMHQDFPLLVNFVDSANTVHIKWLKWLGFTFIRKHEDYGTGERPFYQFVRLHHV